MRTSSWLRSSAILLVLLLFWPKIANTCAPEFPRAVFVRASGPDEPLRSFSRGRIGVPLPTWRRAYLAIAYRHLSGKPLTAAERGSFIVFWSGQGTPERDTTTETVNTWFKARTNYRKEPPPTNVSAWRYGNSTYERYMNCLPNTFETAVRTLKERARRYGENSPELQEWIVGQDKVFQNCGKGSFVPPPAPANASAWLRADRAYQIAAAHFYSGSLDEAVREFDAIAGDGNSPWHTLAPYLAVRTLIRSSEQTTDDESALTAAEQRLRSILGNRELASIHRDAKRLLGLVLFRLHPLERQHQLARLLVTNRSGDDFGQNLLDYCLLLDKFLDQEPDFPGVDRWTDAYRAQLKAWKRKRYGELKNERADELSDWLMTVQSDTSAARIHAIERWHTTGSRTWLFAVASRISGKEAIAHELIQQLSDVPATSPSYAIFTYHRARLLRESGQASVALEILNEALNHQQSLPASAVNLLKDEQMMSSSDLGEFVSKLWRQPVQFLTVRTFLRKSPIATAKRTATSSSTEQQSLRERRTFCRNSMWPLQKF